MSMSPIMTLSERKAARVNAIRTILPTLERALTDYAQTHSGRFLIYGSAVTGRLHYESDVDVLADFPRDYIGAALDFANELGSQLDIPVDVLPYSHCKADFLERVMRDAKVLA